MKKRGFLFFGAAVMSAIAAINVGFGDWNATVNKFTANNGAVTVNFFNLPFVCELIRGSSTTKHTSVTQAIKESVSGDTINVLVGNAGKDIAGYTIEALDEANKSTTLPSGVTMNILYDNSVKTFNKQAELTATAENALATSTNCVTCLMVGENVNFINNGTINVGGALTSGGNVRANGVTSGTFASIILKDGAKLTNKSTMNVYGLVDEVNKGESQIIVETSSTLNVPLRWQDFPGGNVLKGIYDTVDEKECIPLEDFYFENIRNPMRINYGSTVYGWVNLYASSFSMHAEYDMKLFSSSNDSIVTLATGSYAEFDYDQDTQVASLDFYGNATFNNLTIDVEKAVKNVDGGSALWLAAQFVLPSEVSTSQGYFPLSYHFDISLNKLEGQDKATFSASGMSYKMMNGSEITINQGTELNVNRLVVYDGTNYQDGVSGLGMKKSAKYPKTSPATLVNNGTITANELSGKVSTSVAGSTLTISTAATETTYEPKTFADSAMTDWFTLSHTLNFLNSSGKSTTGAAAKYKSYYNESNGVYYYEASKDIVGVAISSFRGGTETTETENNKRGTFDLSLVINPSDHNSTITAYKWELDSDLANKSSNLTSSTISVEVPRRETIYKSKTYNVSCTVSFTTKEGVASSVTGTITLTAKSWRGS